jgi:HEAT repeat protein
MKTPLTIIFVMAVAVLIPGFAVATSLSGKGPVTDPSSTPPPQPPPLTKRQVVKKYVQSCGKKPAKEANCDTLRKEVVGIVKDSLHTLGSSTKRAYVPTIVKFFKSDEVVLRIAAADAMGMIGPQDQDVDALATSANDPVPDVRRAAAQAIMHGKGSVITLLGRRVASSQQQTGLTPDVPPDASKFSMPVAPDTTPLLYEGDPALGWLSYVSKGTDGAAAFYKGKAKMGPLKLDEFQGTYRYQLQDEQEALDKATEAEVKKLEQEKKPDPANLQATTEYFQKLQSATVKRMATMIRQQFQPEFFGAPTVYVLEERQIGQRSYPTRYVVLYQDLVLKRPGYRLAWSTVSDDAIRAAQVVSLKEQKEEEARQAARKSEEEAAKKREAELDSLTKKKDATEKKQFKKGQSDLEKELGF